VIKVALTGSIGMGKSTVAKMFERAGIPLFDSDAEVHRLQGTGRPLLGAIEERFPGTVTEGILDRAGLASRVFGNPEALAALEAIVHPALAQARERFIADHADAPILLFDIPLLFETGGETEFDKVVVVSTSPEIQRQRVLGRAGMTAEKFESILARQMPDSEKRKRADFIVDTSGDLAATEAQVEAIIACLKPAAER
jgi:dephospho-CoA kinase